MTPQRPKICLLICGSVPGLSPEKLSNWIAGFSELAIIAEVTPVLVFDDNSSNITPPVWVRLAQTINRLAGKYHGFVVLHDNDNILYSAAALSFLLKNLNKPIVFTSGHHARDAAHQLESKANILNAAQAAGSDLKEVALLFGNRLMRANRASQNFGEAVARFSVDEAGLLGRVDFGVRIFHQPIKKDKTKTTLALEQNILIIELSPNCDYDTLLKQASAKRGVVVAIGQQHNIPDRLIEAIKNVPTQKPVLAWWPHGNPSALGPKHLLVVNNITWPTTVVKLMWALGQTTDLKKIKELIAVQVNGELLN